MTFSAFFGESTLATASFNARRIGFALAFSLGVGISQGATGVSPSFCSGNFFVGFFFFFGFLFLSLVEGTIGFISFSGDVILINSALGSMLLLAQIIEARFSMLI